MNSRYPEDVILPPSVLMVDHHVVRLDVSVHDAHTMTVVKGPQELIQVATDIIISQGLGQCNSKFLLNTWIIVDNTW